MLTIEAFDLARRFGDAWALDGLTLQAEQGEVIALLGPNGAGKTTTVRLLNGVLQPERGRATVLGMDPLRDGAEVRRRTGVLTEAGGLDDRLTLTENLVSHARVRGIPPAEAQRRAGVLLERFGMSSLASRTARGLSTGERKRVALARALLHQPEVLFLDEPTSGLDPAATRDVLSLIGGLAEEQGATVVLCTHFLAEAARLCRRVAILEAGRLLAFGPPAGLAAGMWTGLPVELDMGGTVDAARVAKLQAVRGVTTVEPSASGARVVVEDRDVIPVVLAVAMPVFSVVPKPPGLEEVYFALTGRPAADTAVVELRAS